MTERIKLTGSEKHRLRFDAGARQRGWTKRFGEFASSRQRRKASPRKKDFIYIPRGQREAERRQRERAAKLGYYLVPDDQPADAAFSECAGLRAQSV